MCGLDENEILLIKFPFDKNIYTVKSSHDCEDLTVQFYSFDKHLKKTFKGKTVIITDAEIKKLNITNAKLAYHENIIEYIKDDYLRDIEKVIDILVEERIPKVVISRQKWINFYNDECVDLGKTFLNLCTDYPQAFVHLFVNKNEAWIGATPEILGKYDRVSSIFETMSLAGTLPVSEPWSDKEIEEQRPVSEYIRLILRMFSNGEKLKESSIYDHISADIKHLCNDFSIKIPKEKISELIENLHPTPAVCGVPKDLCMKIIKNTEKYNRDLYSGYIHVDNSCFSNYYVNLRCAKIYNNGILLHAGGGITQHSNAEKEWEETELKMDVVLRRICINNT